MPFYRLFARIIDPDDRSAAMRLFRDALWLPSRLFGTAVWLRDRGYTRGWLRQKRLPVRVISVGGISVGGAGKTPVTRYLARRLTEAGQRVAILSRGYGRRGKDVIIVSFESGVRLDWEKAGDEPYLLAAALPDVPVIVGADRTAAGHLAIRALNPTVLLLDDGFQHRRLARDLDIVVLDSTHPDGNGNLLPAGPLREPLTALRRADLVVLTRVDQSTVLTAVRERIGQVNSKASIFESVYAPTRIRRLSDGVALPFDRFQGCRVVTLSGIANPHSFERTVEQTGASVVHALRHLDHHPFQVSDIRSANRTASETQAAWIVTTEKDAVRIPEESDRSRILVLEIEVEIVEREESLKNMLLNFEF